MVVTESCMHGNKSAWSGFTIGLWNDSDGREGSTISNNLRSFFHSDTTEYERSTSHEIQ